jgi:hypothetical protein
MERTFKTTTRELQNKRCSITNEEEVFWVNQEKDGLQKQKMVHEISGSHGGWYKDDSFLECESAQCYIPESCHFLRRLTPIDPKQINGSNIYDDCNVQSSLKLLQMFTR